jgi:DNA-binding NarL/FixJ family response regulator
MRMIKEMMQQLDLLPLVASQFRSPPPRSAGALCMPAQQIFRGSPEKLMTAVVADACQMDCQLLANALHGNGVRVIGCTVDCAEVTAIVTRDQPDVAIFSQRLRDGPVGGLAALRRIRKVLRTRVIMLLDDDNPDLALEALRSGARGVFLRSGTAAELRKCVRRVCEGQIWANNSQLEHLVHALMHTPVVRTAKTEQLKALSKRETEITYLVATGLSNSEVSNKLHLSKHTVKNYLFRIFEKLGISNRTELVLQVLSQAKPRER